MVNEDLLKNQRGRIVQHLAQQVNAYREQHKMSKAQFARECGVSVGFLHRLERGDANPRLTTIQKMADFMGVDSIRFLFPF